VFGKYLEGNDGGLISAISRNLPERVEEYHKEHLSG
jgi:hypothetical protein